MKAWLKDGLRVTLKAVPCNEYKNTGLVFATCHSIFFIAGVDQRCGARAFRPANVVPTTLKRVHTWLNVPLNVTSNQNNIPCIEQGVCTVNRTGSEMRARSSSVAVRKSMSYRRGL